MLWQPAVIELHSLHNNTWIDLAVLNLYLYYRWTREEHHPLRYLTNDLLGAWSSSGTRAYDVLMQRDVIPAFRRNYRLPPNGPLPVVPLIFAYLHSGHFFLVIMDHSERQIWVIGRTSSSSSSDPWNEWNGPEIYRHLCLLHGWGEGNLSTVRTHNVVLPQDGVNCGPLAIRCALWLFKQGIQFTSEGTLRLPPPICEHLTRISILVEMSHILFACKADFEQFRRAAPAEWILISNTDNSPVGEWTIFADARIALPDVLPDRIGDHPTYISLRDAILSCHDCPAAGPLYTSWTRALQNRARNAPQLVQAPDAPEGPYSDVHTALQGELKTTRKPYSPPPAELDTPPTFSPAIGRIRRHTVKYKPINDVTLANPKRFARPTKSLALPAFYQETWIKHSDTFDDYHSGPTREEMMVENKHLGDIHAMYTMDPIATYIVPSSWTRFADQGMRLLVGYAHMFFIRDPWEVHAHILPCPNPAPHPATYFHQLHKQLAIDEYNKKHRAGAKVLLDTPAWDFTFERPPSNVLFVGLDEMLDGYNLKDPGCASNLDVFVRGHSPDGKLLCLDLEQNAVDVPVDDVVLDVDIDSLIWVTQNLRFKLSIDVATTPTVGKTPPIRKNNHVYVNILYPPTDQERLSSQREWVENITPLSIVPHTVFAKVSDSSSPIYILICFPRMLHRHEARGSWEALIPFEVQKMFWDEVLLPALRRNAEPGTEAYIPTTVEENMLRAGSKDQRRGIFFTAKTVAIQPRTLIRVQKTMRDIVRNNSDLAMYGSFYFVLDAKNLKLQTRMPLQHLNKPAISPWANLKLCHPSLDFDYMVDRRYGELHVDVAFSFTPKSSVPLVGLWRLDVLEDSFGAGGYNRGSLHNIASLSRYGAMQAPMPRERSQLSHIVFRSAYNLQYESIRASDNVPFFANDGDAYEVNEAYHTECNRRISLFRGNAQSTTYGVRDEYRIGGQGLLSFLEGWKDKVSLNLSLLFAHRRPLTDLISPQSRSFLQANPILWVKSELWFGYLAARVECLQYLQIRLASIQPPNYGVLTSLLCHLIREVSSTHLIPPKHVHTALAHLNAQTIMNNFGTLFLHDLSIDTLPILEPIQEEDDETVLRAMALTKDGQKKPRRPRPQAAPTGPTIGFPLGPTPVWAEVVDAIESHPEGFLQPYQYDLYLPYTTVAAKLFTLFTFHVWSILNPAWLIVPSIQCPENLQDAMDYWTVSFARDHITRIAFQATNGGLTGPIAGHRDLPFRRRVSLFFPPLGHTVPKGSQWWVFSMQGVGYIAEYHKAITESVSNQAALDINEALADIFSHIQLLPFAAAGNSTSHGFVWKQEADRVRIVVNPRYYRMESIGGGRRRHTGNRRVTVSKAAFIRKLSKESTKNMPQAVAIARLQQNLRTQTALRANLGRTSRARNARRPPRPVTKSGTAASANAPRSPSLDISPQCSDIEMMDDNHEGSLNGDPILEALHEDIREWNSPNADQDMFDAEAFEEFMDPDAEMEEDEVERETDIEMADEDGLSD